MNFFQKIVVFILLIALVITSCPAVAQKVVPPVVNDGPFLLGLKINTVNALKVDFVIAPPKTARHRVSLKDLARDFIGYFLTSLAIPPQNLWVNLSPYEKERIIPENFKMTQMGRVLLEQDYLLKRVTSDLLSPSQVPGRAFWDEVYRRTFEKFGTTDFPVAMLNKVWIVPGTARVYENTSSVCIREARLKVLCDQDHAATRASESPSDHVALEVMREVILPVLEERVNAGEDFLPLRQVYHAVILAEWLKRRQQSNPLAGSYAGRQKMAGLPVSKEGEIPAIYQRYVRAFEAGSRGEVRETGSELTGDVLPRKYVTGGTNLFLEKIEGDLYPSGFDLAQKAMAVSAVFSPIQQTDAAQWFMPEPLVGIYGPCRSWKIYKRKVDASSLRGLTYDEAKAWYQYKKSAKRVRFPDGLLLHPSTIRNYIRVVFDENVPGFKQAREKLDFKVMAELYRRYVANYHARDEEAFDNGATGFFYEVGGLRGFMGTPENRFLRKKAAIASLLELGFPGIVNINNPDALQPWEVEKLWDNEGMAKKAVIYALDRNIPGFKKAREAWNVAEMARLYRQYVMTHVPRDSETYKKGQSAFFYDAGLGGLMAAVRPFLAKTNSPASLLNFALPGLIDADNPEALLPWEVETYWKDKTLAKQSVLTALDTCVPGFKGAREKQDVALMVELYRRHVINYYSQSWGKGGASTFFDEKARVGRLLRDPYSYLGGIGVLRLMIFVLPQMVNRILTREQVKRAGVNWGTFTAALARDAEAWTIPVSPDALYVTAQWPTQKAAIERQWGRAFAEILDKEVVIDDSRQRIMEVPGVGKEMIDEASANVKTLQDLTSAAITGTGDAAQWFMPEELVRIYGPCRNSDEFKHNVEESLSRQLDYEEARAWYLYKKADPENRFPNGFFSGETTAINYIRVVLDENIPGFKKAREVMDVKTMSELYRQHVIHYVPRNSDKFNGGQVGFFYEAGALYSLMSNPPRPFLSTPSRPASLLRLAVPELVSANNADALQPWEVEQLWKDEAVARQAIIYVLDRYIPGFKAARASGDIPRMADLYRQHVICFDAPDFLAQEEPSPKESGRDEDALRNGQYAFFAQAGLAGLMSARRSYLSKTGSPAELLRFALPGLIDVQNPHALQPWEVERSWKDKEMARQAILYALEKHVPGFAAARNTRDWPAAVALYSRYVRHYRSADGERGPRAFFRAPGRLGKLMHDKYFYLGGGSPVFLMILAVPQMVNRILTRQQVEAAGLVWNDFVSSLRKEGAAWARLVAPEALYVRADWPSQRADIKGRWGEKLVAVLDKDVIIDNKEQRLMPRSEIADGVGEDWSDHDEAQQSAWVLTPELRRIYGSDGQLADDVYQERIARSLLDGATYEQARALWQARQIEGRLPDDIFLNRITLRNFIFVVLDNKIPGFKEAREKDNVSVMRSLYNKVVVDYRRLYSKAGSFMFFWEAGFPAFAKESEFREKCFERIPGGAAIFQEVKEKGYVSRKGTINADALSKDRLEGDFPGSAARVELVLRRLMASIRGPVMNGPAAWFAFAGLNELSGRNASGSAERDLTRKGGVDFNATAFSIDPNGPANTGSLFADVDPALFQDASGCQARLIHLQFIPDARAFLL